MNQFEKHGFSSLHNLICARRVAIFESVQSTLDISLIPHVTIFFSDNFFDSYLIVPCFHSFIGRCVDFYFISVFWFWSLFIFFISFLFYMNKQCACTGDRFSMLCTLLQTNYTCAIIITLIWRCLCTFFFSVIFLLFQCFHFSFSWLPGYVLSFFLQQLEFLERPNCNRVF